MEKIHPLMKATMYNKHLFHITYIFIQVCVRARVCVCVCVCVHTQMHKLKYIQILKYFKSISDIFFYFYYTNENMHDT